jgi:hypothetical protein
MQVPEFGDGQINVVDGGYNILQSPAEQIVF